MNGFISESNLISNLKILKIFIYSFYFFLNLGSNILLQRLMIQNKDIQQISLFTFDSEMNPCVVSYVILKNLI